ncbi:MAG: translation initiation factor IF-2 [Acidobacteria bacterium]|nr:MAG: translation initiation factor IF-2 [Acidobacteriota bacterium]
MGSIRINELARELEVKSRSILESLPKVGFTEKKSHSSSLEDDVADKVRAYFRGGEVPAEAATPREAEFVSPKEAPAPPEAKAPVPAAPEEPVKHAEPAVSRQSFTKSMAEIKAAARKTVAPRPPVHPVAAHPAPEAPAASLDRVAQHPGAAVPPTQVIPVRAGIASPVAKISEPPAQKAKLSPPIAAKIAVKMPEAALPASEARPGKPARPSKLPASKQPIYPTAGLPKAVPPRTHSLRRPGEPRPMHPTARPAASAAGMARPAGRKKIVVPKMERHLAPPAQPAAPEEIQISRTITITEGVSIKELSEKLEVRAKDVLKRLLDKGIFATINQTLDSETASEIARNFGAEVKVISFEEEVFRENEEEDRKEDLLPRAPVVTVMGHVDHGKTSLLDAIRETKVASGEAGGITQHIGAYQVETQGRKVVFLDTPGHEAFTLMRARGAKVTDIVVLVVAADDGVMPQTLEAINHARAAQVPIVVAINKIDKPDAMPDRVKKQLADRGLNPEDWGGDTVTVEVSAKQRKNLDLLLEMILLVADLQALKANPARLASGTVLEAKLDKGRGPVATVIVQNGTLRVADSFIVGAIYGKIRAMFNDRGQPVIEAPPSTPVEILGLEDVPQAGDRLQAIEDTAKARQIATHRQTKLREAALAKSARLTLEQLHEQMAAGEVKELALIIKADVQGSVEVLADTLGKLGNERVKTKVIHAGVGAITETDVLLASASNAVIVGFNVRPERKANDLAQLENVDIRLHTVIYEVVEEIKKAMSGLLSAVFREITQGRAEVRDTFRITKVGTIAGCYVQEGKVTRESRIRVLRDNVVVHEGRVRSVRRFKEDVPEVKFGTECGISVENFNDIKVGDVLEAYTVERVMEPAIA